MDTPALNLPVLSVLERRLLGVLVEKSQTTPEAYPLSINALVTGSNQKSNRDPLMNVEDLDVEEAMEVLKDKGLTIKITGGRVDRWRHNLYETWKLTKAEMAILAELMLRGAQTEGELRGRASRMEEIATLDELREILQSLVERKFVVYLTPPRSRGAMLTHGFHSPEELARLKTLHSTGMTFEEPTVSTPRPVVSSPPPPVVDDGSKAKLESALNQIEQLKTEMTDLRGIVDKLRTELNELQKALGLNPQL